MVRHTMGAVLVLGCVSCGDSQRSPGSETGPVDAGAGAPSGGEPDDGSAGGHLGTDAAGGGDTDRAADGRGGSRPLGCPADGALAPLLIDAELPTVWPAALGVAELNGLIQPDTQMAAGDLDGDGRPDLVLTQFLGHAIVLHNDGACGFSAWHDLGPAMAVRAADIDADGDVDVLLARAEDPEGHAADVVALFQEGGSETGRPPSQEVVLEALLNDGDGSSFTASDLGHGLPLNQCSPPEAEGAMLSDLVWGLEVHDLDLDGDLDISVRNYFACPAVHLGLQDGRVVGALEVPACRADSGLAIGDVNGDGMGDLVCTSFAGFDTGLGVQIFLGDGKGAYLPFEQGALHVGDSPMGTALLDIDGDGALDLFSSDNGWPRVSLFRDGLFVEFGRALGVDPARVFPSVDDADHTTTWTPVPLDYDGDGDLDIVLSASLELPDQPYPQHVFVYENASGQSMHPVQESLGLVDESHEMSAIRIDIDGDRDEDVVLGNALLGGHALRLLVNGTREDFVAVEAQWANGQPSFGARLLADYGGQLVAHNMEGSSGHGSRARARTHVATVWDDGERREPLSGLSLIWPDGRAVELDPETSVILAVHPGD